MSVVLDKFSILQTFDEYLFYICVNVGIDLQLYHVHDADVMSSDQNKN